MSPQFEKAHQRPRTMSENTEYFINRERISEEKLKAVGLFFRGKRSLKERINGCRILFIEDGARLSPS